MSTQNGTIECFGFKFSDPDLHMVEVVRGIISQCIYEAQTNSRDAWDKMEDVDRENAHANVLIEGNCVDEDFHDC